MVKALKPELDKVFKPAFFGRLMIVPYFPIRDEAMKLIIRLKLGKIQRRLLETHKIKLEYGDPLLNEVAARCTEVESGARNVDNILRIRCCRICRGRFSLSLPVVRRRTG